MAQPILSSWCKVVITFFFPYGSPIRAVSLFLAVRYNWKSKQRREQKNNRLCKEKTPVLTSFTCRYYLVLNLRARNTTFLPGPFLTPCHFKSRRSGALFLPRANMSSKGTVEQFAWGYEKY